MSNNNNGSNNLSSFDVEGSHPTDEVQDLDSRDQSAQFGSWDPFMYSSQLFSNPVGSGDMGLYRESLGGAPGVSPNQSAEQAYHPADSADPTDLYVGRTAWSTNDGESDGLPARPRSQSDFGVQDGHMNPMLASILHGSSARGADSQFGISPMDYYTMGEQAKAHELYMAYIQSYTQRLQNHAASSFPAQSSAMPPSSGASLQSPSPYPTVSKPAESPDDAQDAKAVSPPVKRRAPSFADIAKQKLPSRKPPPPVAQVKPSFIQPPNNHQAKMASSLPKKFHRQVLRQQSDGVLGCRPSSSYGLDKFDLDESDLKGSLKVGSGKVRRGSGSSVASSASGLDEIHLHEPLLQQHKEQPNQAQMTVEEQEPQTESTPKPKPSKPEREAKAEGGPAESSSGSYQQRKEKKSKRSGQASASDPKRGAKEPAVLNNVGPAGQGIPKPVHFNDNLSHSKSNGSKLIRPSSSAESQSAKASGEAAGNDVSPESLGPAASASKFAKSAQTKAGARRRAEKVPPGKQTHRSRRRDREPDRDLIGQLVVKAYEVLCTVAVYVSAASWQFLQFLVATCSSILGSLWSLSREYIVDKALEQYLRLKNYVGPWVSGVRAKFRRPPPVAANIRLPTTGEEAMKRLLSCRGGDPYSILGVTRDASDDDIKKYYRKQAILVHPDKNKQPGAEEAFKILGHAFDLIGDPLNRKQYDEDNGMDAEAESAMKEFITKLEELHERLKEVRNLISCDKCGKHHPRFPVERSAYEARYCSQCKTMHSVKEGDVWAETSFLGFRWHYYAYMESQVFNITQWARCQDGNFSKLVPNAHIVQLKLATGGSRRNRGAPSGGEELEAFLEQLLRHGTTSTSPSDDSAANGVPFPSEPTSSSQTSASSQRKDNGAGVNRRAKRKKKH